MLATFMEVLDTAIASVALPYIAGSLSASTDEATWVLTSYLVANAQARAWDRRMNRDAVTINWQFTRRKAHQKFRYKRTEIMRSET